MTAQEFCYWLQGFFELTEFEQTTTMPKLSDKQAQFIKQHLALVMINITNQDADIPTPRIGSTC